MTPYPDPRTVWRALGVIERLPVAALADLVELLVDRLDAAEPDPDLEAETDACDAGECGGVLLRDDGLPGEPDDAELEEDQDEPLIVAGGPYRPERRRPVGLRPEQEGLVQVWRRATLVDLTPGERRPTRCLREAGAI